MGLILDTSVLIASERRGEAIEDILRQARASHGEIDIALSAISIVELTHGIYRAQNDADRTRRRIFAEGASQNLIVHPVSLEVARRSDYVKESKVAFPRASITQ